MDKTDINKNIIKMRIKLIFKYIFVCMYKCETENKYNY